MAQDTGRGRRDFLKSAAFVATSFALGACGAQPPAAQTGTAVPAASGTGATAPATGGVSGKVVIWSPGDNGTVADWTQDPIVQAVEQATGTTIEVTKVGFDVYTNQINAAIASGTVPDILATVDMSNQQLIQQMVRDGVVAQLDGDLAQLVPNVLKEYELDPFTQEIKVDGKIYAKPVNWNTKPSWGRVIHVRKDLLDKYGLEAPDTFEQLFAFAEKAQSDGLTGVLFAGGGTEGISGSQSILDSFIGAYGKPGAGWVKNNGQWQYWAIQPEVRDGLKLFRAMVARGIVDPASWEIGAKGDSPRDKYVAGQSAVMLWNGGGHVGRIQNDMTLAGKGAQEWVLAAPRATSDLRGYTGGPSFWGLTFVGNLKNNNPSAAATVLDYLSSEEGIKLTVLGVEGTDYTGSGDTIKLLPERAQRGFPAESGDTGAHPLASAIVSWVPQEWQDWQLLYGKDKSFADWYGQMTENQGKHLIPATGRLLASSEWTAFQATGDELINRAVIDIVKSGSDSEADALFDQLVQNWTNSGGDKAQEEMNGVLSQLYG